jgi:hypothetical protein
MTLKIVEHPIDVGINRRLTRFHAIVCDETNQFIFNPSDPVLAPWDGSAAKVPGHFYKVEAEKLIASGDYRFAE